MQVPQSLCLNSQTFNSKFVEFVWQFPTKNQIIFKVYKDGTILLEEGKIGEDGEYVEREYTTSGILTTKNLSFDELTTLKGETVNFLNGL